MTNTCCCDQRFPVIRLGEGKYRIGENGTIIFIRVNYIDFFSNYINYLFLSTDPPLSCYGSCRRGLGYTGELSK